MWSKRCCLHYDPECFLETLFPCLSHLSKLSSRQTSQQMLSVRWQPLSLVSLRKVVSKNIKIILGKSGRLTSSKGTGSPVKRTFTFGDPSEKPIRKPSAPREPSSYEVVVLEMLVDVLLSPERRYINKFATTITSKVVLSKIALMSSGRFFSCRVQIQITLCTE
jgi:hypothetical protein